MPDLVQCGSCQTPLRIPAHLNGRPMRCPACQAPVNFEAAEEIYVAPVAKDRRPTKAALSPIPRGTPGFGEGGGGLVAGLSGAGAGAQAHHDGFDPVDPGNSGESSPGPGNRIDSALVRQKAESIADEIAAIRRALGV